jgi:hypothetical protein
MLGYDVSKDVVKQASEINMRPNTGSMHYKNLRR